MAKISKVNKELIEVLNVVQKNHNEKYVTIWGVFQMDKQRVVDNFDNYLFDFGREFKSDDDSEINDVIDAKDIPSGKESEYQIVTLGDASESEEEMIQERNNYEKEIEEDKVAGKEEAKANRVTSKELVRLIKEMEFIYNSNFRKEYKENEYEILRSKIEKLVGEIESHNIVQSVKWGFAKEAIKHWRKVFKPIEIQEELPAIEKVEEEEIKVLKEVVEVKEEEKEVVVEVKEDSKKEEERSDLEIEIEMKLNELEPIMNEVDEEYVKYVLAIIRQIRRAKYCDNIYSTYTEKQKRQFARAHRYNMRQHEDKLFAILRQLQLHNPLTRFNNKCIALGLDPEETRKFLSERRGWSIVDYHIFI